MLLVLDGYRSHMAVGPLELLDAHINIVYALPAHKSGKTQPLDVTVLSAFKAALNDAINIAVLRNGDKNWDLFTFCRMLTFAYESLLLYIISELDFGARMSFHAIPPSSCPFRDPSVMQNPMS